MRFCRSTKAKPPQLEEEALDLPEDRRLEVLLAVRVSELEKVEHVQVTEHERRGELALSRSVDSSLRMSASGFCEGAVRSNSMPSMRSARTRVDHPFPRHISV